MKSQNNNQNTALYIVNIAARLVIICAVIALLVATVNYFAAPVIAENDKLATQNAIASLFDGAEISTEEMDGVIPEDMLDTVDTVFKVSDTSGALIGYCVKLSPTGFKGEVDLIVAFDADAFVKGVEITSTNDETSGIGTKVKDKTFTDKFIEVSENVISDNADDYIISGATKTSKPVTLSVFTAKQLVTKIISADANQIETEASAE